MLGVKGHNGPIGGTPKVRQQEQKKPELTSRVKNLIITIL